MLREGNRKKENEGKWWKVGQKFGGWGRKGKRKGNYEKKIFFLLKEEEKEYEEKWSVGMIEKGRKIKWEK